MSRRDAVGVFVGLFVVVGVAVGVVGAATTGWAESALATDATGDADRFGPIFVAQMYLLTSGTVLLAGPVVGAPLGVAFGRQAGSTSDGAVVAGAGAGVGAFAMTLVAIAIVVLSQGPAASQAHGFTAVLIPALVGAIATAVVGSVAGAVGGAMG